MKGNEFEIGDVVEFNDTHKKGWVISIRATARCVQTEDGERQLYQNFYLAKLVTFVEHVELSQKELIGFDIAKEQKAIEDRKAKIEQLRSLNAQTRENIRMLRQKQKEA